MLNSFGLGARLTDSTSDKAAWEARVLTGADTLYEEKWDVSYFLFRPQLAAAPFVPRCFCFRWLMDRFKDHREGEWGVDYRIYVCPVCAYM